ncbi:MarR family transcriptional regulator [Kitasatospora sp. GP82]|uniref:MarR family winged helix-turn-helix transcriptional regulator n=1 Tax=Kitasatospora sp. GP82 TaxID=3035089 RepID=UPI0024735B1E|nr:MarR family transcriptional regulator [Kitasatospora sp. GP82]MDH6123763.1 DNA-binding MarR family transcriptional regulator [Kitasatospora sp. GP82]
MAEQEISSGAQAAADPRIRAVGVLLNASALLEHQLGTAIQREAGISHSIFEILLILAERPDGAPMSELSGRLVLTSGGATRLVDRMVRSELVERRPSPNDRRVQLVSMTEQGEAALVRAARAHVREADRQLYAALPPGELATMIDALDRVGSHTRSLLPPLR